MNKLYVFSKFADDKKTRIRSPKTLHFAPKSYTKMCSAKAKDELKLCWNFAMASKLMNYKFFSLSSLSLFWHIPARSHRFGSILDHITTVTNVCVNKTRHYYLKLIFFLGHRLFTLVSNLTLIADKMSSKTSQYDK